MSEKHIADVTWAFDALTELIHGIRPAGEDEYDELFAGPTREQDIAVVKDMRLSAYTSAFPRPDGTPERITILTSPDFEEQLGGTDRGGIELSRRFIRAAGKRVEFRKRNGEWSE